MGCITSKSSNHQQTDDPLIVPNHHFVIPTNTNHTIADALQSKHNHTLTIHTNLKPDDALERCLNFHTVEEYDELLRRNSNRNDAELPRVPVIACKIDGNIETRDNEKQGMEFQTVASLRQWLHAPGGCGDADTARSAEYATPKVCFSFYENNSNSNSNRNCNSNYIRGPEEKSDLIETGKHEEEESIVELVAAFDKYMQQLQIDEDNILKQIHSMIN
ncbi:hypothetical protein R6Q57_026051 [Mikania cordata]